VNLEDFKHILQRYLHGQVTDKERDRVDVWYQSISNEDISPFEDLQHRKAVKEDLFERIAVGSTFGKTRKARIRQLHLMSVAAAALLFSLAGLWFYRQPFSILPQTSTPVVFHKNVTKAGELREISLPDGTSVFLNGNTGLRYDELSYAKNRAVFLDSGEAFFSVRRDTAHPFTIQTGAVSVAVLGTSFNINNSPMSGEVTVEVKTGRVKVQGKEDNRFHILTRGQGIRYSHTGKQQGLFQGNPGHVNLWTQGGLWLNQVNFDGLKEIFHNRYGVLLRADKLDTDRFNYSLIIPQVRSLNQVLDMVCAIHQLKYRREHNEIILYK